MNTHFDDNMVGKWNFMPLYRFIICKAVKWDKRQNKIELVVDDPATAYALLLKLREQDKGTQREFLYDWHLWDSFYKDAEDFCKTRFESVETELPGGDMEERDGK